MKSGISQSNIKLLCTSNVPYIHIMLQILKVVYKFFQQIDKINDFGKNTF